MGTVLVGTDAVVLLMALHPAMRPKVIDRIMEVDPAYDS